MLCQKEIEFLATAPLDVLLEAMMEAESIEKGTAMMRYLLDTNPVRANAALCQFYDVVCLKTGDTCFRESSPAEEWDKWFVSTLAGTFESASSIELSDSEAQAQALAVEKLGLKDLFFGNSPQSTD